MQPQQPGTIAIYGTRNRQKTIGLGNLKKCTVAIDDDFEAGLLQAVGPLPPFVVSLGDWGEVERPEGVAEGQVFSYPLSNARSPVTMLHVAVLPGSVPSMPTMATRTRQGKPIKDVPLPGLPKIQTPTLDSLISWHGYGNTHEMEQAMDKAMSTKLVVTETALFFDGEWINHGSVHKRNVLIRYGNRNYRGCVSCPDPYMKSGPMTFTTNLVTADGVASVPIDVRAFANKRIEALLVEELRVRPPVQAIIGGGRGQAITHFEEYGSGGGRGGGSAGASIPGQANAGAHPGACVSVQCPKNGCGHVTVMPVGYLNPAEVRCGHIFDFDVRKGKGGALVCRNCTLEVEPSLVKDALHKSGMLVDPYARSRSTESIAADATMLRDENRTLLVENARLRRELEQFKRKAGKR